MATTYQQVCSSSSVVVLVFVLVLVVSIATTWAAPTPALSSESKALDYLSQYGYVPENMSGKSAGLLNVNVLSSALKQFQVFAGLDPTGQLDEATAEMMALPRCGVRDIFPHGNSTRNKRYALAGSRWRKQHLTYSITNYPSYLNPSLVEHEVARAFKVWSDYVDLTFTPVQYGYQPDIEIMFASGEHGDGNPFDGRGGTLAHAYFPVYGGDVHFDNSEHWTSKSYQGTNFFQTAAHEIGHALGLEHSENSAALMAPFYRGYEPYFKLHKDDIAAIQTLYGRYTRFQNRQSQVQKNSWDSNRQGFYLGGAH